MYESVVPIQSKIKDQTPSETGEMESQAVVCHPTLLLETKLRFSAKAEVHLTNDLSLQDFFNVPIAISWEGVL